MNILIAGAGGREHALAWKLAQSPRVCNLTCSPGNAGIAAIAEIADLDGLQPSSVARFCKTRAIDLAVIGPEGPLVSGLADCLRAEGIAVFGPSKAASMLEASKAFTKAICDDRRIPTARYAHFASAKNALAYARDVGPPLVVKADGLAAGKGVFVCDTLVDALAAIEFCFGAALGAAGTSVLIEEKLLGVETSFFALCDGMTAIPFGTAKDYKRAFDGDRGPNTGGMGAVSPSPHMTLGLEVSVMADIVHPALDAMAARGTPFQGVLYAGLMLTAEGPKLIEFNVRFGDPECQALLLRLESDLAPVLYASATGTLAGTDAAWASGAAIAVVMAANGYPRAYEIGSVIEGVERAAAMPHVTVFHAGTAEGSEGRLISAGGRVLNICSAGADIGEAAARAYGAVDVIEWAGGFCRRDIGS